MKSYTDIKQSKKLAEILPIESADMWYSYYGNPKYNHTIAYEGEQWFLCQIRNSSHDIPAWSLAALLNVIGNIFKYSLDYNGASFTLIVGDFEITNETTVDACYRMILRLHELNLL